MSSSRLSDSPAKMGKTNAKPTLQNGGCRSRTTRSWFQVTMVTRAVHVRTGGENHFWPRPQLTWAHLSSPLVQLRKVCTTLFTLVKKKKRQNFIWISLVLFCYGGHNCNGKRNNLAAKEKDTRQKKRLTAEGRTSRQKGKEARQKGKDSRQKKKSSPYQTLSSVQRTFVFLGSRCTQPLTSRSAHALRYEFSKWRTGQRGK